VPAQQVARPVSGRPGGFQIGSPGPRFVPTAHEKGFRPLLMGGVLGQVRLAQPGQQSRPILGQATTTVTPTTEPVESQPVGQPKKLPATEAQAGQGQESNWRRKAWGHFRRMDAAEMAVYLHGIEERMDQVKVPRGIVEQIRKRLESFATTAKTDAEAITIDEQEVAALDNAIMFLEQTEAAQGPNLGAIAAAVAGLGLLTAVLVA